MPTPRRVGGRARRFELIVPAAGWARVLVTLTARIRVEGAHYTNVYVGFYDGHPQRGGRLLHLPGIPLIWHGRTATAESAWNSAGHYGTHDMYARILYGGPKVESSPDTNTASVRVELDPYPYRHCMPSISRQVTIPTAMPPGVLPARSAPVRRRRIGRRRGSRLARSVGRG